MTTAAAIYFGATANQYDAVRTGADIWQQEDAVIAPAILEHLPPGGRVLDVAAGTGRWLDVYAHRHVHVTLLDVSPDMLAIAAARAHDRGLPCEVLIGNVSQLSALPAADLLVTTRFFNWIPMRTVARVLRLARSAGIARVAFTMRLLAEPSTPLDRARSFLPWHAKNVDVLLGRRQKGLYYLHHRRRLNAALSASGMAVIDERIIERAPGDRYSLIVAGAL